MNVLLLLLVCDQGEAPLNKLKEKYLSNYCLELSRCLSGTNQAQQAEFMHTVKRPVPTKYSGVSKNCDSRQD